MPTSVATMRSLYSKRKRAGEMLIEFAEKIKKATLDQELEMKQVDRLEFFECRHEEEIEKLKKMINSCGCVFNQYPPAHSLEQAVVSEVYIAIAMYILQVNETQIFYDANIFNRNLAAGKYKKLAKHLMNGDFKDLSDEEFADLFETEE